MARRVEPPGRSEAYYLSDGGLQTDLIYHHGFEIPAFAAHTLLASERGREAVQRYFQGYLSLAHDFGTGFLFDTQTWKAHACWADVLGHSDGDLRRINHEAVGFAQDLRDAYAADIDPVVVSGTIGTRGDAYAGDGAITVDAAADYHARQVEWLAEAGVDMISAYTLSRPEEAIGIVRAVQSTGLPVAISFTTDTDATLAGGLSLKEGIARVDGETDGAAAYFLVNCAHPDHFFDALDGGDWSRRILGIRCNASRKSHAELDNSDDLDDGDPEELGDQYGTLIRRMPWLRVFGGCCGTDLRHVTEIANRAFQPRRD